MASELAAPAFLALGAKHKPGAHVYCLLPLVGYVYQASYLYSIGSYIPMALHTAALFCILAFGILLAQTEAGIVAILTSQTPWWNCGATTIALCLWSSVHAGALVILGEKTRIFPAELAISIIVVGSFAVFSGLIWWNALDAEPRGPNTAPGRVAVAEDP